MSDSNDCLFFGRKRKKMNKSEMSEYADQYSMNYNEIEDFYSEEYEYSDDSFIECMNSEKHTDYYCLTIFEELFGMLYNTGSSPLFLPKQPDGWLNFGNALLIVENEKDKSQLDQAKNQMKKYIEIAKGKKNFNTIICLICTGSSLSTFEYNFYDESLNHINKQIAVFAIKGMIMDSKISNKKNRKKKLIKNRDDSFELYIKGNIDKYYPKGCFTSKKQAFADYVKFCNSNKIKIYFDEIDFGQKLLNNCVLKTQYDPTSKFSRKFYVCKE